MILKVFDLLGWSTFSPSRLNLGVKANKSPLDCCEYQNEIVDDFPTNGGYFSPLDSMTRGPYQTVVEFHPFDGLNQCLLLRDDDQSKLLRRDDCRADALCFISPFLFCHSMKCTSIKSQLDVIERCRVVKLENVVNFIYDWTINAGFS